MKTRILVALAILMALGSAQTAVAEAEAGQLYLSAMGTHTDYDSKRGLDDGFGGRHLDQEPDNPGRGSWSH